ncbi:MAG: ABC transporter substrate-binding protein [Zavarzinella sp.]|nr:ABC transporter substrate-binding protein [Zavarzinella sp.]
MVRNKWHFLAAGFVIPLAVTGCGSSSSTTSDPAKAGTSAKVTIAIPAKSAAASFIQLAVAAGLTSKNGVNVTLQTSIPPASTPAALVSGSIQAAALTSTATQANGKGIPVINVVNTGTHAPFVMLGGPGLKQISNLAGKSVVTSAPTDTPGTETHRILLAAGMADKTKTIPVASVPGRSALFDSGKADAIYEALNLALKDAEKRPGSTIIGDNETLPATPADGLAVTKSYLASHKSTVLGLVKACMQASDMMKNHPDQASPYLQKIYDLNPNEAKQFLDRQKKSLVVTGQPAASAFTNQADLFNKQPNQKIQWTPAKVAASWDTSLAVQAGKELGLQ